MSVTIDKFEYATDAAAQAAWLSGPFFQFTGGTPSASSVQGANSAAAACDYNDVTYWASVNSNPQWWKYDFGAGNAKIISKIRFMTYKDAQGGGIKNFTLSGSNDDASYTTLSPSQLASDVADKTLQDFTFTNTTAYRYYRIDIADDYRRDNIIACRDFWYATTSLTVYTESSIIQEGTYALKIVAPQTTSLNATATRSTSPTLNFTDQDEIKFKIRSSRTGTNLKIGFHDSGGTTTESNIAISSADTWEEKTIDISAVANANKDGIDSVVLTITNADAENTIYLDYMRADNITYPDVKYVYNGVDRGDGTTGILNASNISDAKGSDSDLSADILKSGEVVDDVTGTLESGTGGVNRLMGLPTVLI